MANRAENVFLPAKPRFLKSSQAYALLPAGRILCSRQRLHRAASRGQCTQAPAAPVPCGLPVIDNATKSTAEIMIEGTQ